MLFDPADFVLVNSVGASGLSLAANAKAVNGLFDSRLAPTQIAAVASRLENAVRYLFTKYSGVPASWYDPSDMSTLFQDAAGTVPVTAVEQPVGLQLDKSGRGYHRSQTTTTKRPVFKQSGGLSYLALDGVDDAMVTAVQTWSTTSAVTVSAALQRFDNANVGFLVELGVTAPGWNIQTPNNPGGTNAMMQSNGGSTVNAFNATSAAYKGVLTGRANTAAPSVTLALNGVYGGVSTGSQGSGPYANNPINWFSRNQINIYFKGNAFGEIVIGAQMLDDEVALIEKYLAMKAGVTL